MPTFELKNGYLVGASLHGETDFEPWLVVDTSHGFKFIKASDVGLRPTHDGPHIVFPSVVLWAEAHGKGSESFSQMKPWSQCVDNLDNYSIVHEAEQILYSSVDPAYELSQWLMKNKMWSGSSASAIKDSDNVLAGAFVTLHTSNVYMLRALLKWLGAPQHIISKLTGIEKE